MADTAQETFIKKIEQDFSGKELPDYLSQKFSVSRDTHGDLRRESRIDCYAVVKTEQNSGVIQFATITAAQLYGQDGQVHADLHDEIEGLEKMCLALAEMEEEEAEYLDSANHFWVKLAKLHAFLGLAQDWDEFIVTILQVRDNHLTERFTKVQAATLALLFNDLHKRIKLDSKLLDSWYAKLEHCGLRAVCVWDYSDEE